MLVVEAQAAIKAEMISNMPTLKKLLIALSCIGLCLNLKAKPI